MSGDLWGGLSDWEPVSPELLDVFQRAFRGWGGVGYQPHAVATQIGGEFNYFYKASGRDSRPGAPVEHAIVHISKPFSDGEPKLVEIKSVDES